MKWHKALKYCLPFKEYRPVYDKNGQPHWIELDAVPLPSHEGTRYVPRLCSESETPFSPDLGPYTKKRPKA